MKVNYKKKKKKQKGFSTGVKGEIIKKGAGMLEMVLDEVKEKVKRCRKYWFKGLIYYNITYCISPKLSAVDATL